MGNRSRIGQGNDHGAAHHHGTPSPHKTSATPAGGNPGQPGQPAHGVRKSSTIRGHPTNGGPRMSLQAPRPLPLTHNPTFNLRPLHQCDSSTSPTPPAHQFVVGISTASARRSVSPTDGAAAADGRSFPLPGDASFSPTSRTPDSAVAMTPTISRHHSHDHHATTGTAPSQVHVVVVPQLQLTSPRRPIKVHLGHQTTHMPTFAPAPSPSLQSPSQQPQ